MLLLYWVDMTEETPEKPKIDVLWYAHNELSHEKTHLAFFT